MQGPGSDESTGPGSTAVAPDPITLLLDGASGEDNVLDVALIPVGWFMNDEVIARDPTLLLIVEQNQEEIDADDSNNEGRRYVRTPAQALMYLQMARPGRHRIIVLAFAGDREQVRNITQELMAKSGSSYSRPISAGYAQQGVLEEVCDFDANLIAAKVAYCTVPEELFAKKPESRWGKLWWRYANWGHKGDPRDECKFKERSLIALPKLVPASIVGLLCGFFGACGSTICALYALIFPLVLLFVGYRPKPYWRNVFAALRLDGSVDLRRYGKYSYREWIMDEDGWHCTRRMAITPLELTLVTLLPVVFITHWLRLFTHPGFTPRLADTYFLIWAAATVISVTLLIVLMNKHRIFCFLFGFLHPVFRTISQLLRWTLNSFRDVEAQAERRREKELARSRAAEQSQRAMHLREQLAATKKQEKERLAREKAEQLEQDRLLAAQKKEAEDRQWLMDHLHISLAPTSGQLNFKTVLHHPARTNIMVFKAAFYEAKNLVCKPYAR